jgi:hypothetical protein
MRKMIEKVYGKDYGSKDNTEPLKFLRKKGYPSLAELLVVETKGEKYAQTGK